MRTVMRLVSHRRSTRGAGVGRAARAALRLGLFPFARPIGLDVIITDEGTAHLVEVQHGFGRRGLLELYPAANRSYRKLYFGLRRERGSSPALGEALRCISGDKIRTYELLGRFQPSSFAYTGVDPALLEWLERPGSPFLLAKPPCGSCGAGILVREREALAREARAALARPAPAGARGLEGLGAPMLLQEFVRSRLHLDAEGRGHVGCIRHIVLLVSDGVTLSFVHLPSYWRVSPEPFVERAYKEALTANISRGAFARPLASGEARTVHELAEQVLGELVARIVGLERVPRGTSEAIPARG